MSISVTVIGTGRYFPNTVITNRQLTENLETTDEWIVAHTGIRERRRVAPELATSDMCVAAARSALASAELAPQDVDGRAVWKAATTWLPRSIRAAAELAALNVIDIQHFLHQANLNILTATMTELGGPVDRAPVTLDIL